LQMRCDNSFQSPYLHFMDSLRQIFIERRQRKLEKNRVMDQAQFRLEQGDALRYLLAVPSAVESVKQPWPVLCFLHGFDEGAPARIEVGLTRHGPLRPGSAARVEDFIVIAPQLPVRGDLWRRYAGGVRQIVRDAQKNYGGDLRRTYLTGFSFGGNGVFDLALSQPDFWAALWAVDPTRIPLTDPKRPIWLSFGEAARFNKQGFIRSLGLTPIGSGAEADRVYLDEGADHVGSATQAYRDERIYSWLLSKRLA
jgi:predicted peptidase